jgi:hypothetical protein
MEPAGRHRVERCLAAILAADVAGYSRLIEAGEEGTLGRLKLPPHAEVPAYLSSNLTRMLSAVPSVSDWGKRLSHSAQKSGLLRLLQNQVP